jgi:hypothetical protein
MTLPSNEILAVKPLPPEKSPLLHTCEDGHAWTEQPDRTVSPSWGFSGTHARFPGHDPATCPEPQRDQSGRYECPDCGGRFFCGHGEPGVMCDPWNYTPGCIAPPPACHKPAVTTSRWMGVKMMLPTGSPDEGSSSSSRAPKWTHSWVPLDGSGAPDAQHLHEPTLF